MLVYWVTAPVGVGHLFDVAARAALVDRHPQRVEHELGAHVRRELPADDPAVVSGRSGRS
jgi:hypothetical protein